MSKEGIVTFEQLEALLKESEGESFERRLGRGVLTGKPDVVFS